MTVLTPQPPPRDQQQLNPPPPPLEPLSCLGLAVPKVGKERGASDLVALVTKHPTGKEGRRPGKKRTLCWAFPALLVFQKRATEIYPTGLPRGILCCFLPFSNPNDFQNKISQT